MITSKLYTTEGEELKKQVLEELKIEDPVQQEAGRLIQTNKLTQKDKDNEDSSGND